MAATAVCLVLGIGLLSGAAAGSWLTGGSAAKASEDPGAQGFEAARSLWHSVPVDTLFPRTLHDAVAGPGGAERTWKRIGVAPDADCKSAGAFDPLLEKALTPVGCARLLRATYTDATSSSVVTVGLLVAEGDEQAMLDLRNRWNREGLGERSDLMPRPKAFRGTAAARFGLGQRASWTVEVRTDVPYVVYAVSGFADGRRITEPQPANEAVKEGATTAPAQAGLGHAAQAVADLVAKGLRPAADRLGRQPETGFSDRSEQRGDR